MVWSWIKSKPRTWSGAHFGVHPMHSWLERELAQVRLRALQIIGAKALLQRQIPR